MFFFRKPLALSTTLVTTVSILASAGWQAASAGDSGTLLRGRAVKEGMLGTPVDGGDATGPRLSRTDIARTNESRSNTSRRTSSDDGVMTQLLDAPHDVIKEAGVMPAAGKRNFGLTADIEDFNGQMMNGMPDSAAGQRPGGIPDNAAAFLPGIPMMGGMPGEPVDDGTIRQGAPEFQGVGPGSSAAAIDPDNSPEMQLAWDLWHKRVAETVFTRWNSVANKLFAHSGPLRAGFTYVVTRDGRIKDLRIVKSPNPMFNSIAIQAIKSMDGDRELLKFPDGSRRMMVAKQASFSINSGDPANSMRYTTGDRETVRLR